MSIAPDKSPEQHSMIVAINKLIAQKDAELRAALARPSPAPVKSVGEDAPKWTADEIAATCVKAGLGVFECNALLNKLAAPAQATAAPSDLSAAIERELDLYDEIECDLPHLFGRAALEGHDVSQQLANEVRAKMKAARLASQPSAVPQGVSAPTGLRSITVGPTFDALIASLDYADRKGYLPDALQGEWDAFNWEESAAVPQAVAVPEDVRRAGAKMANTMFNLAQRSDSVLSAAHCASFKAMQLEWDAAIRAAIPTTPSGEA